MTEEQKKRWEEFILKNLDVKKVVGKYIQGVINDFKYGEVFPYMNFPEISDDKAITIFKRYNPNFKIEEKQKGQE